MTIFKYILKTQNLNQIGQKVKLPCMLEQINEVAASTGSHSLLNTVLSRGPPAPYLLTNLRFMYLKTLLWVSHTEFL